MRCFGRSLGATVLVLSALAAAGCQRGGSEADTPEPGSGRPVSTQPEGAQASHTRGANADGKSSDSPVDARTAIQELATSQQNPFTVPAENNPEALQAFVDRLARERPKGRTREEMGQNLAFMMAARFVASDRLAQIESLTPEARGKVLEGRLDALRALALVGPEGTEDLFRRECQQAIDGKDLPLALAARQVLLLLEVDLLGSGEIENPEPIANKVDNLLQQLPQLTEQTFSTIEQTAVVLEQAGHESTVTEILGMLNRRIAKDTSGTEAATFQARVEELQRMLPLIRVQNLIYKLPGDNTPERAQQLAEQSAGLLVDAGVLKHDTLSVLSQAAQTLEFLGHITPARELYASLGVRFGKHEDERIAQSAVRTAEIAERRLGLVGEPLELTGTLLNGTPFNWDSYRGKVVLIDFWATWCGPCLAELPNIRKNYDRWHDAGFDVVGINLDDDRTQLDSYLNRKPLRWTTIVATDPTMAGFENPNAVRCGVEAIPFLVLVERDGTVGAIHVSGERLGQELDKRLGTSATGG